LAHRLIENILKQDLIADCMVVKKYNSSIIKKISMVKKVRMKEEFRFEKVAEIIRDNQYLNEGDVYYDVEKETKGRLVKLQQYQSVVNKIEQASELINTEVDIKFHGRVFEELSTESHGRNRNGYICKNKKTVAIKVFVGMA
jgi:hypothetical protein